MWGVIHPACDHGGHRGVSPGRALSPGAVHVPVAHAALLLEGIILAGSRRHCDNSRAAVLDVELLPLNADRSRERDRETAGRAIDRGISPFTVVCPSSLSRTRMQSHTQSKTPPRLGRNR